MNSFVNKKISGAKGGVSVSGGLATGEGYWKREKVRPSLEGNGIYKERYCCRPSKLSLQLDDYEEEVHLLALSMVDGVGPSSISKILGRFGSAKNCFTHVKNDLRLMKGLPRKAIRSIENWSTISQAERIVSHCIKSGIKVCGIGSGDYPKVLREIYDAPPVLFQKGESAIFDRPSIAIVGTRNPSNYGIGVTEHFSDFFSKMGFNIISGLAYGIDEMVHKVTLDSDGITSAILGHGLDRVYPAKNEKLSEKILEGGGALVSEYFPGVKPSAKNFPARNRIIAGLCIATIVIEAGASGGALITARAAFEQDRQVFAVPGDLTRPQSEGCNKLIRDHVARLVTEPSEVYEEIKDQLNWAAGLTSPAFLREVCSMGGKEYSSNYVEKGIPQCFSDGKISKGQSPASILMNEIGGFSR